MKTEQGVPQHHHIKLRSRGITQKKECNKGNCGLKFVHQLNPDDFEGAETLGHVLNLL